MQPPPSNNVIIDQAVKLKLSATGVQATDIPEDPASFLTVSLSKPFAVSVKIKGQYLLITFKKYGPVTVTVSIKDSAAAAATFNVSAAIDIDYIAFSLSRFTPAVSLIRFM